MARPRKEQELDIARRAVEETIRLLAVRGDFDVPLSEVAQAVGCTAPALYSHFRNKNALLRAARDEGFRRLYKEKLAVPGEMRADPIGYLRGGSYVYVRFALGNPTLYRLMFTPPTRLGVGDDPWSNEIGRQILSLLLKGLHVVSICSVSDRNAMPRAFRSVTIVSRCGSERPSRSSFHTISVSPAFR